MQAVLVSIDKVFLSIVCMCHHSGYHRNSSLIRSDVMRCGTLQSQYIYSATLEIGLNMILVLVWVSVKRSGQSLYAVIDGPLPSAWTTCNLGLEGVRRWRRGEGLDY